MPRRQVYGRRAGAATSSFLSTRFSWPSPIEKSGTNDPESREQDIADLTKSMKDVRIADNVREKNSKESRGRDNALQKKDHNAVPRPLSASSEKTCNEKAVAKGDAVHVLEIDVPQNEDIENKEPEPPAQQLSETTKPKRKPPRKQNRQELLEPPAPSSAPETPEVVAPSEEPVVPALDPHTLAHISPLLPLCSAESRHAPVDFSTWSSRLEPHFTTTKIAEASYGEVYRLSLKRSVPNVSRAEESVLKIVALKPPPAPPRKTRSRRGRGRARRNEDEQEHKGTTKEEEKTALMSDPNDVASEVRLLRRLTPIPGFTLFRSLLLLQGRPSPEYCAAWKTFNASRPKKDKSIFPDPNKTASYGEEQLWAVIEMQDAGTDLERVQIEDVWGVWDIFWGVALAVGKAEEGVGFEHRDLHLGNICVRSTRGDCKNLGSPTIQGTARRNLGFTGLETTVIDYTLSRAEMDDPGDVAFMDLEKDQAIFDADGELEYQYDIYRFMRAALYFDDPMEYVPGLLEEAEASGRTWRDFKPLTNLVWLHFILYKLLESIYWPSASPAAAMKRLGAGEDKGLALKKAWEIEKRLLRMQEMLEVETLKDSNLKSAGDLVVMALEEGWLNEQDVMGCAGIRRKTASVRKTRPRGW